MTNEPIKDVFNRLCYYLDGHNLITYDNCMLFDFEYDKYTFTMKYENNQITLANNVDVYDSHDNFKGNYTLEEVNTATTIEELPQ